MKCAMDDTIEYVKHLAQQLEWHTASGVILIILMMLGIPTNYDGFEYLRIAVLMRYENSMVSMTNDVYPELRRRYGKYITDKMLETAIRSAIVAGWKNTDMHTWKALFPTILAKKEKRPTNTEFIFELARIVEMWCDFADAYKRQLCREEVGYGIQ